MVKYTYGFPKSNWLESDIIDENDENSSAALNATSSDDNQQTNLVDIQHIETIEYEDVVVFDHVNRSPTNQIIDKTQSKRKRKASKCDNGHNNVKQSRSSNLKANILLGGKYFSLVSKTLKGTEAKCMSCGGQLKGYGQSNSNYISHLKIVSVNILQHAC